MSAPTTPTAPSKYAPVLITLGSNIAPRQNLPRALALLRADPRVALHAVSRVYETAPLDANGAPIPDQAPFLNAAAWLWCEEATCPPLTLKFELLRPIEAQIGRVRGADKFAPRPIDLDIALYVDRVLQTPRLVLPDPDILRRAHVALPLADVAPDWAHPLTGEPLRTIAARFANVRGVHVCPDCPLWP